MLMSLNFFSASSFLSGGLRSGCHFKAAFLYAFFKAADSKVGRASKGGEEKASAKPRNRHVGTVLHFSQAAATPFCGAIVPLS